MHGIQVSCRKSTFSALLRFRDKLAVVTVAALCTNVVSSRQVFVSEAGSVGGGGGRPMWKRGSPARRRT